MPARFPSPVTPNQPIIEGIIQPLYHMLTLLAAAPAIMRFFQNTGGLNELQSFPGLLNGGQLPNPKIFVVKGYLLQYDENVIDGALIADLKTILYNSWVRFFVGIKEYLTVPAFYLNSGLGIKTGGADFIGGVANLTATVGDANFYNNMNIKDRPITLPPQQGFYMDLNPVGVVAGAMFANRRIWAILKGEHGREVM
ncbi:MAG: hypothetical protein ABIH23_32570 [bacterium]